MADENSAPQPEQSELEQKLRKEIDAEYAAKYTKAVQETVTKLTETNKQQVEAYLAELKKQSQPPTVEELQKVLDQEYLTFEIKVPDPLDPRETRRFTIRELPQAVEKRFYNKLKEKMLPLASELASLSLNLLEGDAARKIEALMNAFEPLLDVLAWAAALALNPFGEEKDVDVDWVQKHISSSRILQIVNVQMECNRLRDFFSYISQSSKTANPANLRAIPTRRR